MFNKLSIACTLAADI